METTAQVTTFPLKLQPTFSEVVSKAAKQTPLSKHDWVVQAIKEKLERDKGWDYERDSIQGKAD